MTLKLYSIAKIKQRDYTYQLSGNGKYKELVEEELGYYEHVINTVNRWLSCLSIEEQELIKLRFFEHHTVDDVSCVLGYASHSSVVKNCKNVIRRIKQKEKIKYDDII